MANYKLTDGPVKLTGRKVTADRKVELRTFTKTQTPRTESTVTYEPHGSSGSGLDVNTLVYELMIIAGYDMLQVGHATYGGDYTAAELAGKVSYLPMFMENDSESCECYHTHIHIKTKTFDCSFDAGEMFETMAEWEGVAGIAPSKAHKFHVDGKEMPKGAVLKKYTRCHGYKPTTISMVMYERHINEKFEVLGNLYKSLTSEGMRKAMSVCAAARLFDNKSYELQAIIKKAMRWKLWKDYAKKDGASMMPVAFSATDFQCGPECYKQVDTKYVQELVDHWNKLVADNPMPEWPKQGDVVQFKNREKLQKKYRGKYLCEGMTAMLSTYGDRIEWRASVRVKKFDNEYFLPGQLEPVEEVKSEKRKVKSETKKPKAKVAKTEAKPETTTATTMDLAEQLRQALLARLAA